MDMSCLSKSELWTNMHKLRIGLSWFIACYPSNIPGPSHCTFGFQTGDRPEPCHAQRVPMSKLWPSAKFPVAIASSLMIASCPFTRLRPGTLFGSRHSTYTPSITHVMPFSDTSWHKLTAPLAVPGTGRAEPTSSQ